MINLSYRVCLQCGRKTLVFPNGLCRICLLKMKLRQIVGTFLANQTKPSHVALPEQQKSKKDLELDQTYYVARCEACYQAQGGCYSAECLMYPRSPDLFEDQQVIIKVFRRFLNAKTSA